MAESTSDRRIPVACTVVARNYLPAARVLARSYLDHHPGHRFVIAVIDRDAAEETPAADGGGTSIVGHEVFGIDEDDYLRMATGYSVTELATAVKPYLLRALRAEHDVAIYLDPDIQVFAGMAELVGLASAHQIVLTPHFLKPLPRDGKQPSEAAIMGSGIFNLGFVAVGPGSQPFLDFWALRLRHDAIAAPEQQLFTDQRWVDQVPALFKHHVLRDPGYNVAYWNAHERPVERSPDGTLTAGGKPLRFFHFSGYRPENPWLLTHHTPSKPRVLLSANPEIRALCDDYRSRLRQAGYAETLDATPYGFAELPDGTRLGPALRRLFRDAWVEAERADEPLPPHGFGPDGGAEFRAWLASPPEGAPARTGLTRLTAAIWQRRADLRRVFPEPNGRDAEAFLEWCRTSGVAEEKLADWALPVPPPPFAEPSSEFGVNVLGYLTAELGVGEMGRILHDAVRDADVPMVSVVEDRLVVSRTGIDYPETEGKPRYPVSLLCVNADQTQVILESHPEAGHHRYRIGVWAWELDQFPEPMHPAFGLVDEVWTISEFCREAIARRSPVPVKAIPVPVREHEKITTRREPGELIQFLFVFDFNSVADRKNPWGLVEAFQRAFDGRDNTRLVIKSINGDKNQHARERLRMVVGEDSRIELVERYLDTDELYELYRRSHCYVSLHRSEGFGLTVAEAMARGMPVIATDYSSTAEFLDERTGWPVPCRLVEVGKGNHPYPADATWAEPDLDAAARAMRQVADEPEEAARRGDAAREHIRQTRSMGAAADWIGAKLRAAHQSWALTQGGGEVVPEALRPLRDAREALRWRAEVASSSRTPLAPALRKVVLRAIDHYDVHQRTVLGALTDGVEHTTARLLARIEELEGRLDRLRSGARLDALERQVGAFRRQRTDADAAMRDLQRDVSLLRDKDEAVARVLGELEDIRSRLDEDEKKTFDMFVERDRRSDANELALRDLHREFAASQDAVAMRHAPVPANTEVVLCDAGALLVPRDNVFLPWLRYHRTWEDTEARLLAELSGAGLFVDVGAHIGYHTLRLLRDCPNTAGVVAIEANPDTARLLTRNLEVNLPRQILDRVTVLPMAAWDEDGSVRLGQEADDNSGDFRVLPGASPGETEGTVVPAKRLDGVPEIRDRTVSLIKIDLQGRDHRAIAGLGGILERDRPHVVCEFSPADIEELGDQLADVLAGYHALGYELVPVTETGPLGGEHGDQDLIAMGRRSPTGFVTLWLRPG